MINSLPQPLRDDMIPAILALNNAHAVELSPLTVAQLEALLDEAFYAQQIGDGAAFLLAFDQGATYESPNYLWFRRRYREFVYIDRVVVSPPMRGRGYARTLYMNLFAHARQEGHSLVVCEVNRDPPIECRMRSTRRCSLPKSVTRRSIHAARPSAISRASSDEIDGNQSGIGQSSYRVSGAEEWGPDDFPGSKTSLCARDETAQGEHPALVEQNARSVWAAGLLIDARWARPTPAEGGSWRRKITKRSLRSISRTHLGRLGCASPGAALEPDLR